MSTTNSTHLCTNHPTVFAPGMAPVPIDTQEHFFDVALNSANLYPADAQEMPATLMEIEADARLQDEVIPPETSTVWGTDFARITMQGAMNLADRIIQAGNPEYFVTANLNYLMLCEKSERMRRINRQAAAVIADGNPIVMRSRCGLKPLPERVAGSDFIVELGKLSAHRGYRIFLLGAAPGVAAKAAEKLAELCPGVHIAGCLSPPFRPLTEREHEELLQQIRESEPQILLVAFGQPKGELWIDENLDKLRIPLSIQLGASFDFLAGTAQRAPAFWQSIGGEWLYRTLKEPRRLGPRYAKNILFLSRMLATDLAKLLKLI